VFVVLYVFPKIG
jgi:ABC-2 type transport system permease protein